MGRNTRNCEKTYELGEYKVQGLLDKVENMVKKGMIEHDNAICLIQELADVDSPTTLLDEVILDWIDKMEERVVTGEDTYKVVAIGLAKC